MQFLTDLIDAEQYVGPLPKGTREAIADMLSVEKDLLAACHQALSVLVHVNFLGGKSVEEKQIRAAIVKAEGRS